MANKLKSYLTRQTASYTIALCAAVALFMALSNLGFVASVLKSIVGVLSPFIYAFVLAFILNRPVMWFEKKIFASSKHKKFYSIICVYIIAIVAVTGLLLAVIPQLGLSISYLIDTLPDMMRRLYRQAVVIVTVIQNDATSQPVTSLSHCGPYKIVSVCTLLPGLYHCEAIFFIAADGTDGG